MSKLPFDIDGLAAYKLPFDPSDKMASTKDGRHWKQWVTSNRVGFLDCAELLLVLDVHMQK